MCSSRTQEEMSEDYETTYYTDGNGRVITEHFDEDDGSTSHCKSPSCRDFLNWTRNQGELAERRKGWKKHSNLEEAQEAAEKESEPDTEPLPEEDESEPAPEPEQERELQYA